MTPPNRSKYQEKIIKNYYRNRDAIAVQRAQELVGELYLTEGKKRKLTWDRLCGHLEKAGLPADRVTHLREQDNPELVAEELRKLT